MHQVGFIPHWRLTSAAEPAQWQVAVALSLSSAQPHTSTLTFRSPPLSSSSFFSFTLAVLYICHIGIPPMKPVPAPIPRSPSEMCSSKHFTLAYAKGKWQRQVCDRHRTVSAQGCYWQSKPPLPMLFLYLLNYGYVWFDDNIWWCIVSIYQNAPAWHPQWRKNKATLLIIVM